MPEENVLTRKKDHVCTLTLNRPQVKNAWTVDLVQELTMALNNVASDQETRVVVIEGSGRDFSSGADMSIFRAGLSAPEWLEGMQKVGRMIRVLREIPQPIIAKVRGMAVGGGASLALAADLVVAADDARFSINFVNIGIIPDAGATFSLPRLVGLAKAKEIALLGDILDGKTAAQMGLIYKSVPDADLDKEVALLTERLAKKSLAAMALIKEGFDLSFEMSLKEALEWEAAHQAIIVQRDELKATALQFMKSKGRE